MLHCFGSTYLSTLQTDLTPTSVQQLEQLLRHKQLRHYVQTLVLKSEENGFRNDLGRGFSWNRSPSGCLIFPHPYVQALQAIMTKLENCQSFQICSYWQPETCYHPDCLSPSDSIATILHIIAETSIPIKSRTVDLLPGSIRGVDIKRSRLACYQKKQSLKSPGLSFKNYLNSKQWRSKILNGQQMLFLVPQTFKDSQ